MSRFLTFSEHHLVEKSGKHLIMSIEHTCKLRFSNRIGICLTHMNICILTQPVAAMQQPAYWAVPPGATPAGTVTVPYAGPTGSQMQIQGQVQVCIVFISSYFCEFYYHNRQS